MSELKPCPFCNCPEVTLRDDGEVHCDLCQSSTGFDKQWNLRPIEDAQAHELATANSKVEGLTAGLAKARRLLYEKSCAAANLDAQLAKANALLDEVGKWRLSLKWDGAKIGTHKFGIFTELDDILSKRREVE